MSRIGKKPVPVPAGVTVSVKDREIVVKGKSAELKFEHHPAVTVAVDGGQVVVTRSDDKGESRISMEEKLAKLEEAVAEGKKTAAKTRVELLGKLEKARSTEA